MFSWYFDFLVAQPEDPPTPDVPELEPYSDDEIDDLFDRLAGGDDDDDDGKLLDVECLDSLVIGRGRWVSLRERGLGFEKG
jgi:hypothetical protein